MKKFMAIFMAGIIAVCMTACGSVKDLADKLPNNEEVVGIQKTTIEETAFSDASAVVERINDTESKVILTYEQDEKFKEIGISDVTMEYTFKTEDWDDMVTYLRTGNLDVLK